MKKFVSWRRVSTDKQGKSGLGLEAQAQIIDYFVKAEDGILIADFSEVHTGKDLAGCEELQKAVKCAQANDAILIIAKTDRFRNTIEALQIYDKMGAGKIYFCDLPHTDKFTLTLFHALAEREALITSLRTKAALNAKKAQGWKLGAPNAHFTEEQVKRSTEIRKANAERRSTQYIDLIAAYRKEGKTLQEIADTLNAKGFTTPRGKAFAPATIAMYLKRV